MFLSEVAHNLFCVKFRGLISKLKIRSSKNHINVREYSTYRLIFGLFLKLKENYGAPMEPSELFCFKDTKKFAALLFFLAACNEKFQQANAQSFAYAANANANANKAGWTRDSQARTRLVDSLFFITCSLENNAFSVLHYVINVALHYSILHRFQIFSAPGTIAHGSIRLPPRSLASSRGCSLAITYQQKVAYHP